MKINANLVVNNHFLNLKTILFLLLFLGIFSFLYWIPENEKQPIDPNSRVERLKDPSLLYFSYYWAGLCSNKNNEDGGCYEEVYLYNDGQLIKNEGWVGLDNGKEIEPTFTTEIGESFIKEIKDQIKSLGIMDKNCPEQTIMDAGWEYQINLDGNKKSFSNPPESCSDILKKLDKVIESKLKKGKDLQQQGTLGKHNCISKFKVERNDKYPVDLDVPKLELFQSFDSGAFYGKIVNYQPEQNKEFSLLADQLMKEQKIPTYEHLKADICLYKQDFYNPPGGATLNYYIEHYYCTNSCQTDNYELRVDLNKEGNFVGYRR